MAGINLSIITTSFNKARFIEETIQSVLSQKGDFSLEYIIVDGGSTDGTLDILRRYNGQISWISEPDDGQYDAANKGFRMARGEIIGWIDADDLYTPEALQRVTDFFRAHPGINWAYSKCRIVDENGQEIKKWITTYKNLLLRCYSYRVLLCENYISQPTVFFRCKVLDEVGYLNTRFKLAADYEYWLRLGQKYPAGVINDYLACFRSYASSTSNPKYKEQFSEELRIVRCYTTNRLILLTHYLNYLKIIGIYSLLRVRIAPTL